MSFESRTKKLRGSGGYIMASINDDLQRKGNLGGPDLFLAPVGRIDSEKFQNFIVILVKKTMKELLGSNLKIQMRRLQKI